jgi:hypothetical protein
MRRHRNGGMRNLRADVRLTATVEPGPPTIPNVQHAWAREDTTTGPCGEEIAFYLAWVYGHVVSTLACSGRRESWPWTDVVSLATRRRSASPNSSAARQLRPNGGVSRLDEALDMQCCPGLKAAGFASVRSWRPGRCPRSARTPRARPPRGPASTGTSPGTAWSPDTRGRHRCPPSPRRGRGSGG